jgi:hypothetical protein
MTDSRNTFDGGCTCGAVQYRLESEPLFVHCCHCTWCQRETGSAFALNALIEADRVTLLQGQPEMVETPSNSGKGQNIWRCPECFVALWSCYVGFRGSIHFVRVGTLDNPGRLQPDIHIFTASKLPWVAIPEGQPAVEIYYRSAEYWPEQSLERLRRVRETGG